MFIQKLWARSSVGRASPLHVLKLRQVGVSGSKNKSLRLIEIPDGSIKFMQFKKRFLNEDIILMCAYVERSYPIRWTIRFE